MTVAPTAKYMLYLFYLYQFEPFSQNLLRRNICQKVLSNLKIARIVVFKIGISLGVHIIV